jgi:hypothetical protein
MIEYGWIASGLAAFVGAVLLVLGLKALFGGRFFDSVGGIAFGGALLVGGIGFFLLAQDIQTYQRLTFERPVATIALHRTGDRVFDATLVQADAKGALTAPARVYPIYGDEWRIEARVLKWKPWANVLGLNAQYKLNRLAGEYIDTQAELTAKRSVYDLNPGPQGGVDVWTLARQDKAWHAVDALYGSAALMPMADGAKYEVWITQSGLIARPINPAASQATTGWR